MVELSSCEAEYIVGSYVVYQAIWIKGRDEVQSKKTIGAIDQQWKE